MQWAPTADGGEAHTNSAYRAPLESMLASSRNGTSWPHRSSTHWVLMLQQQPHKGAHSTGAAPARVGGCTQFGPPGLACPAGRRAALPPWLPAGQRWPCARCAPRPAGCSSCPFPRHSVSVALLWSRHECQACDPPRSSRAAAHLQLQGRAVRSGGVGSVAPMQQQRCGGRGERRQ